MSIYHHMHGAGAGKASGPARADLREVMTACARSHYCDRVGFAEDMEAQAAVKSAAAAERARVDADRAARLAVDAAGFLREFEEATEYLAARGVPAYQVVSIRHAMTSSRLERVYPFKAISIGNLHLHDGGFGGLCSGHMRKGWVKSRAWRIRRDDWVIDLFSSFSGLDYAPVGARLRGGGVAGEDELVLKWEEHEGGYSYAEPRPWLLAATARRLKEYQEEGY